MRTTHHQSEQQRNKAETASYVAARHGGTPVRGGYRRRIAATAVISILTNILIVCLLRPVPVHGLPPTGILYVAQNGNDITAVPGDPVHPYFNLSTALALATPSAEIRVFPGSYTLNSAITLGIPGLRLVGAGATIKIVGAGAPGKINVTANDVSIEDVTFDFNDTTNPLGTPDGPGIKLSAANNVTIKNCVLKNTLSSAIEISDGCSGVRILHNRIENFFCAIHSFSNNGSNPVGPLLIEGNIITDGWSTDAESGGIKIQNQNLPQSAGAEPGNRAGHVVSNNRITNAGMMGIEMWNYPSSFVVSGNHIQGTSYGISCSACVDGTITGNTVRGCSFVGIEIAASSRKVTVTGNTINGKNASETPVTETGITVVGLDSDHPSDGNILSANQISWTAVRPMFVLNSTYTTVIGNTCTVDRSVSGIEIAAASNTKVSGNTFRQVGNGYSVIILDAGLIPLTSTTIVDNTVAASTAVTSAAGVSFYIHGNANISDTIISGNHVDVVSYAGTMLQRVGNGSGQQVRTIVKGNTSSAPKNVYRSFLNQDEFYFRAIGDGNYVPIVPDYFVSGEVLLQYPLLQYPDYAGWNAPSGPIWQNGVFHAPMSGRYRVIFAGACNAAYDFRLALRRSQHPNDLVVARSPYNSQLTVAPARGETSVYLNEGEAMWVGMMQFGWSSAIWPYSDLMYLEIKYESPN